MRRPHALLARLATCFLLPMLDLAPSRASKPDAWEAFPDGATCCCEDACEGPCEHLSPYSPGAGWSLSVGAPFQTVGGGLFEERLDRGGWTFEAMARQPIGQPCHPTCFFLELGGSFTQNFGDDGVEITSGTFVEESPNPDIAPPPPPVDLDSFFETTIDDLRRATAQVAIGATLWQRPSPAANSLYLEALAGVRLGHARASFTQAVTPELQSEIDAVAPGNTFSLRSGARDTDTFFGAYANVAVGLRPRPCGCPHGWSGPHVQAGLLYDHSWIDLGDYGRDDRGLGTLSAMLSVAFLR